MSDITRKSERTATDQILSKLSRATSAGIFIPEIDGLRFFAIMSVMMFHLNYQLQHHDAAIRELAKGTRIDTILRTGEFGVELFFVVSGFILALPFALYHLGIQTKRIRLSAYYLRRLSRLEPTFFICILILFAVQVLFYKHSVAYLLPHLLATLTYMHVIVYKTASVIYLATWSLEVEIQFYILAPVIALLYKIRQRTLRIGCFALLPSVASLLGRSVGLPVIRANLIGSLSYFIVGFILVDLYIAWGQKPRKSWWWDALGTTAWLGMIMVLVNKASAPSVCFPVLILLAYIGVFRGPLWNRVVTNRWLTTIGGMCYTIYLYHCLGLGIFYKVTSHLIDPSRPYWITFLIQSLVVIPPILAMCALLFISLEKPFMYRDWPYKLKLRLSHFFSNSK